MTEPQFSRPTRDNPMLIGLLVDVSGSMMSSIRSVSGPSKARLESFRDALDNLVEEGKKLCRDEANQEIIPLFQLFAYGFGFGNLVTILLGNKGPKVRDLLDIPGASDSTIAVDRLAEHWEQYKAHVRSLAKQMLGDTPMLEAVQIIKQRFAREREIRTITEPPILFVLSDGEPTDSGSDEVVKAFEELKASGVFVVSCYVTDIDVTHPRKLYNTPQSSWPEGARLMFQCASPIPKHSPFASYLQEYQWDVDQDAHLFTQINQSEILKEFLAVIISPLQNRLGIGQPTKKVRVFVSYSHQNREYLAKDSLLGYVRGLEQEGFEFWSDQEIRGSDFWDEEIREQIRSADIALVLVSQAFLNSRYCREEEITAFLMDQRRRGLRIFPVLLEACDWKSYDWLKAVQCQPGDNKNIKGHFKDGGKRAELFCKSLRTSEKSGKG